MNLSKYTLTMAGLAVMSMSLPAATITYNFSENGAGDIGLTSSFVSNPSGGPNLVASGFSSDNNAAQLYGKNNGGDEVGVGLDLRNDPDHEIQGNAFIQIDIEPLLAMYGNMTFQMNSTTDGETWDVYATNTASTMNGSSFLKSGTNESSHTFSTSDRYLDFSASDGNVLLRDITAVADPAPEPGTMGMLAGGFAMLGLGLLRRKKQVKQA